MADRDAAAELVFLGQLADQFDVHVVGRVAGIEMHVDVDVVFSREIEHAMDLPGVIRIEVGRGADHAGALVQRLHQQRVGAGIVGQSLLREYAEFKIDSPGVVAFEGGDGLEGAEFDAAVEFDVRAHPRGAEFNAAFQGLSRAAIGVLDGEAVLDGGDAFHGHGRSSGLRRDAIDDAGFFQVDVGFHKAGADEVAFGVIRRSLDAQGRLHGDDRAIGDADIDRRCLGCAGEASVAYHEIHRSRPSAVRAMMGRGQDSGKACVTVPRHSPRPMETQPGAWAVPVKITSSPSWR